MIKKSIHFDLKTVSQKCEEYAAVFKIVAVAQQNNPGRVCRPDRILDLLNSRDGLE